MDDRCASATCLLRPPLSFCSFNQILYSIHTRKLKAPFQKLTYTNIFHHQTSRLKYTYTNAEACQQPRKGETKLVKLLLFARMLKTCTHPCRSSGSFHLRLSSLASLRD